MDTKHKNKIISKISLSLLLIFIFMFSIPFISSLNSDKYIPLKLDIKEKKPLFSDTRTYENEFISIKSNKDNSIDTSTAIFNDKYVSIKNYDKKHSENYEVSFYTGNDGIPYKVLKSQDTEVSKDYVRKNGYTYVNKVYSKDGYVTVKTSGFSTLILDIPDITIPFNNLISLDLQNYFSEVDHYYVAYVDEGNVDPNYAVVISEGFSSLNTDTFEVNLYRDTGNAYLDLFAYEQICSTEIANTSEDCFYLENDVDSGFFGFNNIKVYACDVGETTQSNAGSLSSNCSVSTNFDLNTYTTPYYYRTSVNGRTGLHKDMIDAYDFNYFWYDEPNSELVSKWGDTLTNNGATYTEVNEFKAGGYEGGAFNFDGTNDYITATFPSITDEVTVSFYLNWDDFGTSNTQMIIESSTSNNLLIHTGGSAGTNGLRFSLSGGTYFDTTNIITSGTNLYTISYNTTTAKIYRNGVLINSGDFTWTSPNGTNLYFGSRAGTGLYYDGLIDEIIIFNRALTSTEINYIYNNGNGVDFFNLNTPQWVGINIDHNESIGTYKYYLNNYFVWDGVDASEYTFTYEYYDFVAEQWLNLTSGFSTTFGSPSDVLGLALLGDELTITYYGNTDPSQFGFEGVVYAENSNGDLSTMFLSIAYPLTPLNNVTRLATPQYQQTSNFSLSMNTYYGNYTDILVEYQDNIFDNETIYNVALNTSVTGGIVNQTGNITVELDPLDVSGNVYLNVYEVPNKTFSGEMSIIAYNSISNLTDIIYINSGDVIIPSDLIKANMTNISIEYGKSSDLIDLDDYFYNISNFTISTIYDNVTYSVQNPTRPIIYNYTSVNDSNNITMFDMWIKQGILEDTNTIDFDLKAFTINSTQKITVTVYDNQSNQASQNFYIIVTPVITMTETQSYLSNLGSFLTGFFPDASTLTSVEKIGIIVVVLLILTIGSIAFLYKLMGSNSLYVAVGLDILAFLLFLGIGYISVGFMVFVALALIGLTFLRIRS